MNSAKEIKAFLKKDDRITLLLLHVIITIQLNPKKIYIFRLLSENLAVWSHV